MKVFIVISICLLVGGIEASHEVSLTATICEKDDCECEPPKAATLQDIDLNNYNKENECYCACGKKTDEDCMSDDDCVLGLHCAAGDKANLGKCRDACEKPGLNCDIFDKCVVDKVSGEPECICKIRACSDMQIGTGMCTYDPVKERTFSFKNDCLFVNEKCRRRGAAEVALERKPAMDCAEVIQQTAGIGTGGVTDGWQMSGW